ncbi:MAG: phosphoribosylanthranilate isomerase [Candidatus Bathyarchaeota archaeon]|nr:phosphoribosylanthranilate isomerase [Candidatus Bathyarchaeota archaeon]MCX8177882.1 phosphoribosylanthranilate isomerase [Candidatus Bathyarchaeota archaeon]MDW8193581.1 phosphoribosylanthranilate isomerase [Nitrososphaerota archaeon]
MKRVKVKICGITRREDLETVCRLGADMVGFIVEIPSSPRNITLERAKILFRLVPENIKSVLVMAPENMSQVLEAYEHLKPHVIQFHGNSALDFSSLREKLPETMFVRALPITGAEAVEIAKRTAAFFDGIIADSHVAGKHGGTGVTHDWLISRRVRDAIYPKPLILAGGLNPENVKDAVETVRPYAVDVSTGVESSPGIKDPRKVEAFIRKAKEATFEDDIMK